MDSAGRLQLINELCAIEGRGPGTDAERRAANMLAGRLRSMGRRAELQASFVHPQFALVHAAHCVLGVVGSLLALEIPAAGFALVLLAATSTYLDLNTRAYLVRSRFFRRGSQNVVSPGPNPGASFRVILTAHYDAGRTGYVFGPRAERVARRLSPRARLLLGPFRLIFWGGLAPLLPVLGMRMVGVEGAGIGLVQLVPTLILVVAVFLLVDIALSDTVPGAYDNASGVAGVLSVAAALDRDRPSNLDVWVVLAGAEETLCEGMRSFVRDNREQLDPKRTAVICVDSLSYGTVHYEISEGAVISQPLDARLAEICEAIAAAGSESGSAEHAARPVRSPMLTDALPAVVRGLRAISITSLAEGVPPPWYHTPEDTPERVDAPALDRATEFIETLVRRLDADLGRALAAPGSPASQSAQPRENTEARSA